jgi:type VI secretion system protein ImpC
MSTQVENKQSQATTTESVSLLEQAVAATRNTERSRTEQLLQTLTAEALKGTVSWNKNLSATINEAIAKIDEKISKQVTKILHAPEVQKLEGSWRGLHYLIKNTSTSELMKVKLFNASKEDIQKDFNKILEPTQSLLFEKIYEDEFGTPGGEPYGLLIGDYEFGNNSKDVDFLTKMSGISATAFAPFVTAANGTALGLDSWEDLSKPKDLEKIAKSYEFNQWNNFRDSEDAAFVTLAMPRVLSRLPYNDKTNPADGFTFNEVEFDKNGRAKKMDHNEFTWMNAAYVMGAKMTESFEKTGWCTAIRGASSGGKVEGLPTFGFVSDDGDIDLKCPTEIAITDRREKELANLGFMPLSHYKKTDYAVFFGAQTAKRPKIYEEDSATENAAIAAKLPYIMVTSRVAHHVKIMGRDMIGSMKSTSEVEADLNKWIKNYIDTNPNSQEYVRHRYPLAEAKISVEAIPGRVGAYHAVAYMKPWLPLEELSTSLRLVASIPGAAGGGEGSE